MEAVFAGTAVGDAVFADTTFADVAAGADLVEVFLGAAFLSVADSAATKATETNATVKIPLSAQMARKEPV